MRLSSMFVSGALYITICLLYLRHEWDFGLNYDEYAKSCRTDTLGKTNSQNSLIDFDLWVCFLSVDSGGLY